MLRSILKDEELPPRVREHAAGALGEANDHGAIGPLIQALDQPALRRGAAVALGRLRAQEACKALECVAPRCSAARWALGQLDRQLPMEELLADLRDGQLLDIRRKIERLDEGQRNSVMARVFCELRSNLAKECADDPRWMVAVLQYDDRDKTADALTDALKVGMRTYLHPAMLRAVAARRPLSAIEPLVQLACRERPGHAEAAAACLQKICRYHGNEAIDAVRRRHGDLKRQLTRLRELRAATRPAKPSKPWHGTPGSPKWFASVDRAIASVERLLRTL
jgi:hypothetical protein